MCPSAVCIQTLFVILLSPATDRFSEVCAAVSNVLLKTPVSLSSTEDTHPSSPSCAAPPEVRATLIALIRPCLFLPGLSRSTTSSYRARPAFDLSLLPSGLWKHTRRLPILRCQDYGETADAYLWQRYRVAVGDRRR